MQGAPLTLDRIAADRFDVLARIDPAGQCAASR